MTHFSLRILLPCLLLAALLTAPHSTFADTAIVDFEQAWPESDNGIILAAFSADSTMGWSFTPRNDIQVTDLGYFDGGIGLSMLHKIGIWDAAGQLLTSTELGNNRPDGRLISDPPFPRLHEGDHLYATIEPLVLVAGETYVIGATTALGSNMVPAVVGWGGAWDMYPVAVGPDSLVVDPQIGILEPALLWHGSAGPNASGGLVELHLPSDVYDGGTFVGVNFKFTPVPEPVTLSLLALGGAALIRRRKRGICS
jgi:hypothetical protein